MPRGNRGITPYHKILRYVIMVYCKPIGWILDLYSCEGLLLNSKTSKVYMKTEEV